MGKKIRVAIIFGGKSAEHEVSLRSAKNVVEALAAEKYDPVLIGIDKEGVWYLSEYTTVFESSGGVLPSEFVGVRGEQVIFEPQGCGKFLYAGARIVDTVVDVVFPILHGPFGEDGTIQGLLQIAGVSFVGSGVLGSAVGMDKDVMKRLLRDAGIPVCTFVAVWKNNTPSYQEVVEMFGAPFFVKPANMGSSVGVSKVSNEEEYGVALIEAFRYDQKILIEESILGREIECAVLGNSDPVASVPGEVVINHDFYSYDAKYIDEHGATLVIPAVISVEQTQKVQELALRTFRVLGCEGLGRVDFFLRPNGDLLVNEINTIPGFTSVSMFPKLWEASGVSYGDLVDRLLELALEK